MVISVELWPRREAVAWVKSVVASHPHHNVIIATHSYLTTTGTIYTGMGGYGDMSPKYLYDQAIHPYANVKVVLSGHTGQTFTSTSTGKNGNKILNYLTTIHSNTTNPIRMIEFDTSRGSVKTWVHGPRGNATFPAATGTQTGMTWVAP